MSPGFVLPMAHPPIDEAIKVAALAALEAGQPWRKTAGQYGVSVVSLSRWRREMRSVGAVSPSFTETEKVALTERYLNVQHAAVDLIEEGLGRIDAPDTWKDMQSAATVAGIATTKLQDLTEGRGGKIEVNVDSRTQSMSLDGLDIETLRWLRSLSPEERSAALSLAKAGDTLGARTVERDGERNPQPLELKKGAGG